jgi:2-oxoglutarate ferredoxin oxidoreductase subunit alpha
MGELVRATKNVLCVELNIRQYTEEVERVSGRLDLEGLYKVNGRAISPYEIVNKVKEVF